MAVRSFAWMNDAACRGEPLDLFFGIDGERGGSVARRQAKAKAICQPCPARAECADHALSMPEKYGIFGGLSEEERAKERRRRARREPEARAKECAA